MGRGYWLVKQEPTKYSFDQLVADGGTMWDGVRNFQARNNLQAMRRGDRVLFYHSVVGPAVVGICEVTREAYPDPTAKEGSWVAVDLAPVRKLKRPVTLEEIKADRTLRTIPLVRQSRLSVMPIEKTAFDAIVQRGGCCEPRCWWHGGSRASAVWAGELEQLRNENAQLRSRVQELERENARLRGDASHGLSAALEQRATAAVAVAPGETPGTTSISTEASRLEGIGGGKSRHGITWRAEPRAGGGRPDAAAVVIDTSASGSTYRGVSMLRLVVDGTPVDCPVADYRTEIAPTGRDGAGRIQSEHVTATVPAAVLDRVAEASDVSGTLGPTTFHLTPEQLAAARAFVQRLGA